MMGVALWIIQVLLLAAMLGLRAAIVAWGRLGPYNF
jgi:hypothetical protein